MVFSRRITSSRAADTVFQTVSIYNSYKDITDFYVFKNLYHNYGVKGFSIEDYSKKYSRQFVIPLITIIAGDSI